MTEKCRGASVGRRARANPTFRLVGAAVVAGSAGMTAWAWSMIRS